MILNSSTQPIHFTTQPMKNSSLLILAALLCFSVLLAQNVTKSTSSLAPLPAWEYAKLVASENGSYAQWMSGKLEITQEGIGNFAEALKINGVLGKEVPDDVTFGEIMNALGARRWELCSTDHPSPGFPVYHFKRTVQ